MSQRKKVEDELNKRDEYHMPDQDTGQTMSKKYELLTARYRSAALTSRLRSLPWHPTRLHRA